MAIEIVDFPINKHGDFPLQNVSSPEGTPYFLPPQIPGLGGLSSATCSPPAFGPVAFGQMAS